MHCSSKTDFISITSGYKLHCSNECAHKTRSKTKANKSDDIKEQINQKGKLTRLAKYGDENYNNREKAKETMIELYGGNSTLSSPILSKKVEETKLEKYGDAHYNNPNKNRETCLEKYGVDNVLKVPEIQEKINNTKIEKYGSIHVTQNEEIMNKVKRTNLEKYGVEWSFQSENNKSKSKETWMHRYGCHVSCADEIIEKVKISKGIIDKNDMTSWDRARLSNENAGRWMPKEEWSKFKLYSADVWKETNKHIHLLENFDKRGRGSDDYHCDHMYSIHQGFKDNVPAEIIGSIFNLEMINSRVNMSKNIKCSITLDKLLELYKSA